MITIDNPVDSPDAALIDHWEEAICDARILSPREYYDAISNFGNRVKHEFYDDQVIVDFEIPLSEMIGNFFDHLKSATSGYASVEYSVKEFRRCDLDLVIFHLNGDPVDALTFLVYKDKARKFSENYAKRLKEILPPQLFAVAIQAKVGGKIIARESIKALRKDVLAKLYGGDQTRKDKLLKKQKKGKKLMRTLGKIEVKPDVFFKLLKK